MSDLQEEKPIVIHHINIRQSISFMVLRFILIETLFPFFSIFFCFPLACFDIYLNPLPQIVSVHTGLFILLVMGKAFLMIYVTLDWLNEYYVITPDEIIHQKGTVFKIKEKYSYNHLMSIELNQTIWGKLLNYGTIHMYDRNIDKNIYLNFIHNPQRYFRILQDLIPHLDKEERLISGHVIENAENGDANH